MTQSGQVRDACDRCHGIKTRCERIAGDRPGCQRCDRLGVSCSYSPPGQTGRPPGGRKRKEPDAAAPGEPDRPSRHSPKLSERFGERSNINVLTNSATITALPSPEASTGSSENMLNLTPSEAGQFDGSFRMEDFPISPWPYYAPDIISQDDIMMDTHNDANPVLVDIPLPPLLAQHAARSTPCPQQQQQQQQYYLGRHVSSAGQHPAPTSPADATHMHLMQLADLQSKILVLGKSVAEASDSFSSIEEVLIVSESFIAIFQAIEPHCHHLPVLVKDMASVQQQKDSKTSQTAIFLLSNCYLNLIDIFETLVAQLQSEQSFQDATAEDQRHHLPPRPCPQGSLVQSLVSIGSTRVSLSRPAAAEVHLHLVFCMFDRLATSLGVRGGGPEKPDGDKIEQSIAGLAGRAVRALSTLEERMAQRRGKTKFQFVIES